MKKKIFAILLVLAAAAAFLAGCKAGRSAQESENKPGAPETNNPGGNAPAAEEEPEAPEEPEATNSIWFSLTAGPCLKHPLHSLKSAVL